MTSNPLRGHLRGAEAHLDRLHADVQRGAQEAALRAAEHEDRRASRTPEPPIAPESSGTDA